MNPDLRIEPIEARVLGVLIEKELTTPEQYPLSLNALTNGCNQKNNRHPVLSLTDEQVQQAILRLRIAQLVEFVQLVGQRVEKYRQKAGVALGLEPPGLAVMAELLLRGAQTAGELRQRADRMQPLPSQSDLEAVLAPLMDRGFVVRLPPVPGTRASLYAERLSLQRESAAAGPSAGPSAAGPRQEPRDAPHADRERHAPEDARVASAELRAARPVDPVGQLAARLAALEAEVVTLRSRLDAVAGAGAPDG